MMFEQKIQQNYKTSLISAIFAIDTIILLIEGIIDKKDYLIYLSIAVGTSYCVVGLLEYLNQLKNEIIISVIVSIKGVLQLVLASYSNQNQLVIVGVQITCLLALRRQYVYGISILFHAFYIMLFSIQQQEVLIYVIIRSLLSLLLIFCVFWHLLRPFNKIHLIEQIILSGNSNVICLLDQHFRPIVQNIQFTQILSESVTYNTDCINNSLQRIVTPRDLGGLLTPNINENMRREQQIGDEEMLSSRKQFNSYLQKLQDNSKQNKIQGIENPIIYTLNQHSDIIIEKLISDLTIYYAVIKKAKIDKSTTKHDSIMKTVYKVSHDMRTPLNAIINMQMCLKDYIDVQLSERYLKPSLNSCKLLLNLLNDILDSAQWENKKIRLVFRRFNFQKLIAKTIQIFDMQKEKKEIIITNHYNSRIPQFLYSDKNRIRQILINLLSNAVKYTPPKGQILINCEQYLDIPTQILVSVSDTGIGIKKENLQLLFSDFSRVCDNENIIFNPKGVGLGLQISNELAKLLGSTGLQVDSIYGSGCKFSFVLENHKYPIEDLSDSLNSDRQIEEYENREINPKLMQDGTNQKSPTISIVQQFESSKKIPNLKLKQQITTFQKSNSLHQTNTQNLQNIPNMTTSNFKNMYQAQVPEIEKTLYKKNSNMLVEELIKKWNEQLNGLAAVLIVDDNEFNIAVLQYLLENLQISSDSAVSGHIALNKVLERQKISSPYQLILLDIEMPLMDGIDTAKKLLDFDNSLKIMVCSAHRVTQEQLEEYKNIGILGAFEKPISKVHLKDLLQQLAEKTQKEKNGQDSLQFSHYF